MISSKEEGKPLNHPHDAEGDEDGIPGPEDEIDLVDDDIEGKDAEGIQLALAPRRPVLIVVATGHLGPKQNDAQNILTTIVQGYPWEGLTHRVVPPGELVLLWR